MNEMDSSRVAREFFVMHHAYFSIYRNVSFPIIFLLCGWRGELLMVLATLYVCKWAMDAQLFFLYRLRTRSQIYVFTYMYFKSVKRGKDGLILKVYRIVS